MINCVTKDFSHSLCRMSYSMTPSLCEQTDASSGKSSFGTQMIDPIDSKLITTTSSIYQQQNIDHISRMVDLHRNEEVNLANGSVQRLDLYGSDHKNDLFVYPQFNDDGELNQRVAAEHRLNRRLVISKSLSIFAVLYILYEGIYFTGSCYFQSHSNLIILAIRSCIGLGMFIAAWLWRCSKHALKHFEIITLMASFVGVVTLIAIEPFRVMPCASITYGNLLLFSIVFSQAFIFNMLRIKFVYLVAESVFLIVIFVSVLIGTKTSSLDFVGEALAFIVCMNITLLYVNPDHETFRREDFTTKRLLMLEQRKIERLLKSMLPNNIIAAYLDGRMTEFSRTATLAYCEVDVKATQRKTLPPSGILPYVNDISPSEFIQRLHDTFKRIDGIVALYSNRGIQKIEIVGKLYLFCAGLMEANDDGIVPSIESNMLEDNVKSVLDVSFEIMNMALKRRTGFTQKAMTFLRIGVSTGNIVGGIIGNKRRYFRVFGDTVNVSARMCSNALPGEILMSKTTYDSLSASDRDHYAISAPRMLEINGMGPMSCYVVDKREGWTPLFDKSMLSYSTLLEKANTSSMKKSFVYHRLLQNTSLHPITLRFSTFDHAIEQQYQSQYLDNFINGIHFANVILLLAMGVVVAVDWHLQSSSLYHGLLLAELFTTLIFSLLVLSKLFLLYMQQLISIFILLFITWIVLFQALLHRTDHSFLSGYFFVSIIMYTSLLLRLQFRLAFPVIVICTAALIISVVTINSLSTMYKLLVCIMCASSSVLSLIIIRQFETRNRISFLLRYALQKEKYHMDMFLHNLLPGFVVEVLKKRGVADAPVVADTLKRAHFINLKGSQHSVIPFQLSSADPFMQLGSRFALKFNCATVFESDIFGFPILVSNWKPEQTLSMLNELFCQFDEAATFCKVERIDTIGSSYVCVNFDGPPDPILDFALMIQRLMTLRDQSKAVPIQVRMGVSTGPAYGGIVGGSNTIRFSMFGEVCNDASNLKQFGSSGQILVAERTYFMANGRYIFTKMTSNASSSFDKPWLNSVHLLITKVNDLPLQHPQRFVDSLNGFVCNISESPRSTDRFRSCYPLNQTCDINNMEPVLFYDRELSSLSSRSLYTIPHLDVDELATSIVEHPFVPKLTLPLNVFS